MALPKEVYLRYTGKKIKKNVLAPYMIFWSQALPMLHENSGISNHLKVLPI